jgi:hypothetical protein
MNCSFLPVGIVCILLILVDVKELADSTEELDIQGSPADGDAV